MDEKDFSLDKIREMIRVVSEKNYPRFSFFMDAREQYRAKLLLKHERVEHYLFDGGYAESDRKILCVYPDGINPSFLDFPLCAVRFTYRAQDVLSHRDFLGSLMALNIKRETLGDIVVLPGEAVVFLHENILPIALEIVKIGRTGVKSELFDPGPEFTAPVRRQEIDRIVSSLRLDNILGSLCGLSRGKSADFIVQGLCTVNYEVAVKKDMELKPGDIISVKRNGKYRFLDVLGRTKKQHYRVRFEKYL